MFKPLKFPIILFALFFLSTSGKVSNDEFSPIEPNVSLNFTESKVIGEFFAKKKVRELDSLLNRYEQVHGFNGAVLVARHGQLIFARTSGYSNPERTEQLQLNTPFQLASVSKQFTAAGIMILAERGIINYDDKVVKYIPNLPYNTITIRHLLHHTAGLPNYMALAETYWKKPGAPTNDEVIEMLRARRLPLNFRPGLRYQYSNTGYVLLGSIIERASGQSYSDFLKENIFDVVGMQNTYVYNTNEGCNVNNRAFGFNVNRNRCELIPDNKSDGAVGDKGIFSTIIDMYKWDQALYSNLVLSEKAIDEAFTPGRLNNNREVPYGMGWRISEDNGKNLIYHNGLWRGFRTSFLRYVEEKSTVIVLNNTNCRSKNPLVRDIQNILNKPEKPSVVEVITRTLLEHNPQVALQQYYLLKEQYHDEYDFNDYDFIELAYLLFEMQKPSLASDVLALFNEIHEENISLN